MNPSVSSNSNLDISQVSSPPNGQHVVIFRVLAFLSCGMFMMTGIGFFITIPVSIVFTIFYTNIFTRALQVRNVKPIAVYGVTFTLIFAYISILFNFGIGSDHVEYFGPYLLGKSSTNFSEISELLFYISVIYLIISIRLNLSLIKRNASNYLYLWSPVIFLILIAAHWTIAYFN